MRVIALDPGGSTGWATLEELVAQPNDPDLPYGGIRFECGVLGPKPHHSELREMLENFVPNVVISESFMYRNTSRTGLVLDSVEYIGILKLFCHNSGARYVEQSPAQAKGFVKDTTLKKIGWYSTVTHSRDAARHLMYYLVNSGATPEIAHYILDKAFR